MRTATLGRTGMQVSRYCLGTMMFGIRGNSDHADCERIIHAALDAGINFIDTSDTYSSGEAEEIVGSTLKGRRDNVVVATKVFHSMGTDVNMQGNSRRWITQEVESSLRRLQTDWIDLYQLHRPDPTTSIDETLSVLSDLVHQGKIRAIGCSSFPPELIVESHWAADRRGLEHFACDQSPYSIFVRGIERASLATCQKYDMASIVYNPLLGGWLTGKFRTTHDIDMASHRVSRMPIRYDPALDATHKKLDLLSELEKIAAQAGLSITHLAMGFVVAHPAVTAAIIGPRLFGHLEDLLDSSNVDLDDEILDLIDVLVAPGTIVDDAERSWVPPSIIDPSLRRRPVGDRAAD